MNKLNTDKWPESFGFKWKIRLWEKFVNNDRHQLRIGLKRKEGEEGKKMFKCVKCFSHYINDEMIFDFESYDYVRKYFMSLDRNEIIEKILDDE